MLGNKTKQERKERETWPVFTFRSLDALGKTVEKEKRLGSKFKIRPSPPLGPGFPYLHNCHRSLPRGPFQVCSTVSVPTATRVIGAVIFHLELTLCSVSNFKQILFLSLHFRGEKTRPSWVFHCPQQTRACRLPAFQAGCLSEPWAARVQHPDSPRGHKDLASSQADGTEEMS